MNYKYTEKELDKLLKENFTIIIDTREQKNQMILDYFLKIKVPTKTEKLDSGDYGCYIAASPELGIIRDTYLPIMIEKKNSCEELSSSFVERTRFESEFIRAKGKGQKIYLLIEDRNYYQNIIDAKYNTNYTPKALMGSLKAFEQRYNINIHGEDKELCGNWIYGTLKAYARAFLLGDI